MLERRRHAVDLGRCDAKFRRLLPPRRNRLPRLPCDPVGFGLAQFKIAGDFKRQIQRCRIVVDIDGCGQNPRLDVGGNRVEVVCRGQPPPSWPPP